MTYRRGSCAWTHIETDCISFCLSFLACGPQLYRFMGIQPYDPDMSRSEDDIRRMVSDSEKGGEIDPVESRLIDNVFDFADRVAREVMVPRQDMICLFVKIPWKKT